MNASHTNQETHDNGQDNEVPIREEPSQLSQGKQVGGHPQASSPTVWTEQSESEARKAGESEEGGWQGSRPQELQRDGQQRVQPTRYDQDGKPKEATQAKVTSSPTKMKPPYPAPEGYYWHNDGIWYLARITKASF